MTVVAIKVTKESIKGNIPLVPRPKRACSNVPGIDMILDDPNTMISMITLAMSPDMSPPSAQSHISWSSIFFGPKDIYY